MTDKLNRYIMPRLRRVVEFCRLTARSGRNSVFARRQLAVGASPFELDERGEIDYFYCIGV